MGQKHPTSPSLLVVGLLALLFSALTGLNAAVGSYFGAFLSAVVSLGYGAFFTSLLRGNFLGPKR